jgi:hypothetical protein
MSGEVKSCSLCNQQVSSNTRVTVEHDVQQGNAVKKVHHVFCRKCAEESIGLSCKCPIGGCLGTIPNCGICLDVATLENPLEKSDHHHQFHSICMDSLIREGRSLTCPQCRDPLSIPQERMTRCRRPSLEIRVELREAAIANNRVRVEELLRTYGFISDDLGVALFDMVANFHHDPQMVRLLWDHGGISERWRESAIIMCRNRESLDFLLSKGTISSRARVEAFRHAARCGDGDLVEQIAQLGPVLPEVWQEEMEIAQSADDLEMYELLANLKPN